MRKTKIAVIGVGGIAQEHIAGYKNNENVELYAFCDINQEQVKKMGEMHGVTNLFTSSREMFATLKDIDAVSVCTWNSAHAPCTIEALQAGCHVLCEKPMATSAKEAEKMLEASKKAGKLLMIGFVRRFGNDCTIVKDYIDEDYFGDIYYSKATYLRRNGCPGGWFGDKSKSGGGPLIDLGVHVIDLTRYLMGNKRPVSVYGATFHKLSNRPELKSEKMGYRSSTIVEKEVFDVEDLAVAMIRYEDGSVMSVETSFSLNIKKDEGCIELFGSKAGARLNPELEIYTELNGRMVNVNLNEETALNFSGLFQNEINHFVDCVAGNVSCIAPADDGVVLMKILDAIYESGRTGREVMI